MTQNLFMVRITIVVFFIFSVCLSCTKDKAKQVNQIVSVDSVSDGKLKTIRTNSSLPTYPYYGTMVPEDSSAKFNLDLDGDLETDFEIVLMHYRDKSCFSAHSNVFYRQDVIIKSVSASSQISLDSENKMYPRNYYENEQILNTGVWSHTETYALVNACSGMHVNCFISPYWALRFKDHLAWIKIKRTNNNGLDILGWAYAKNKNQSLKAGQKN